MVVFGRFSYPQFKLFVNLSSAENEAKNGLKMDSFIKLRAINNFENKKSLIVI
jgi:hypothetical protein